MVQFTIMAPTPAQEPSIAIQKRDLLILHEIAESPACLRRHIAAAFFEGRYEAAKKRLQALAKAGYVENADTSKTGRSIVCLTAKGRETLREEGFEIADAAASTPPERFRLHEMMLADCRAALLSLAQRHDYDIEFTHGPDAAFAVDCNEHHRIESVRPDGFARIECRTSASSANFFLELDRGTETLGHLLHLAEQYDTYRRSGDFKTRISSRGGPGFRVLLVVASRKRLHNVAEALSKKTKIRTLVWLSTFEDFKRSPAGTIWQCPADRLKGDVALRTLLT